MGKKVGRGKIYFPVPSPLNGKHFLRRKNLFIAIKDNQF